MDAKTPDSHRLFRIRSLRYCRILESFLPSRLFWLRPYEEQGECYNEDNRRPMSWRAIPMALRAWGLLVDGKLRPGVTVRTEPLDGRLAKALPPVGRRNRDRAWLGASAQRSGCRPCGGAERSYTYPALNTEVTIDSRLLAPCSASRCSNSRTPQGIGACPPARHTRASTLAF